MQVLAGKFSGFLGVPNKDFAEEKQESQMIKVTQDNGGHAKHCSMFPRHEDETGMQGVRVI